jgi:hypothetical protein
MTTGKIHYKNETGYVLRRRGGEEVRPLNDFWTSEYERSDSGFTILEDLTEPVIPVTGQEIALTSEPQEIPLPTPKRDPYSLEVVVHVLNSESSAVMSFNRPGDPTAPVDIYTNYCERIDTRRVRALWLSGTGSARVIFKEVLSR